MGVQKREGKRSARPIVNKVLDNRGEVLVNFGEGQGLYILNSLFMKKITGNVNVKTQENVQARLIT